MKFLDLILEEYVERKIAERKIRALDDTILYHVIKASTTTDKNLYDGWIGEIYNYVLIIDKLEVKSKKKRFSAQQYYNFLWGDFFQNDQPNIERLQGYYEYQQKHNVSLQIVSDDLLMSNIDSFY